MTTQSEAILENELIQQLREKLRYSHVQISDEASLLANLKAQLEAFNDTTFSAKEFDSVLNHLSKGNVFEKAKTLRDRFCLTRDNGEAFYVQFFDSEDWNNNLFQVTNQVTVEGVYKNRYDVTLLINGLPLVQIELKRRGLELKEAFNQINRYQRHTFWTNSGLYQYVQIFVISNGVNTKYYANNRKQSFKQTFFWADVENRNIKDLAKFADLFLNPDHLGKMIAHYVVFNETYKILMVLRPYQYYATEAIITKVKAEGMGHGAEGEEGNTETSNPHAYSHGLPFELPTSNIELNTDEEANSLGAPTASSALNTENIPSRVCGSGTPKEESEGQTMTGPNGPMTNDVAVATNDATAASGGYVWHTTGSGKTLTSFKASQIIMDMPEVHKVVFVVDRKDLDYQTINEFKNFKKNCVDMTSNTKSLVRQFTDSTKLIVTTIQKLNNAITHIRYNDGMTNLRDKRLVFIFDECHRSQFGETHKRITAFFQNAQLFGFTGTPIFSDNASKNALGKRTTKDLFGECLHKYVITDAIRDQNVLRFSVEYLGRYKKTSNTFMDIDVEDIDTKEVIDSPERLEKIVDYISKYHGQKTHNKKYSAIFAVSSIATLIKYYKLFKAHDSELRIATIFTYGANEDDESANGFLPADTMGFESSPEGPLNGVESPPMAAEAQAVYNSGHTREILDGFISDYNKMYNTSFSTKDGQQFENYFKDISKRLKEREKEGFPDKDRLDILLVVNMFLTGFDAKMVNTLYVDKNLHHHGLIQAFSRTNRIINEQKSHGNILCFRNLKDATDEAITLFSNKRAKEDILLPPYEDVVRKFSEAFGKLLSIAPTVSSVDDLSDEEKQLEFIQAFRNLIRLRNVLTSFADFSWEDLAMTEQSFEDFKSKYLDLHDKVKSDHQKEKTSILEDVDFELELIHKDDINVLYILKLLQKLKQAEPKDIAKQTEAIMNMLDGEMNLRSKRELIEKFIKENLPNIEDADMIPDEFEKYWQEQKKQALDRLCQEENLDEKQFLNLIDAYVFSEQEPIRDDVLKCLENRPSILQAKQIGKRIIDKMKEFVNIFIREMVA